mmetsp:Transcript_6304/g.23765  ORF Transcript_6304/g.23765 Transcript_6304/m.23765 type:complete len:372 (-) Transcript_6304:1155-2270(-)
MPVFTSHAWTGPSALLAPSTTSSRKSETAAIAGGTGRARLSSGVSELAFSSSHHQERIRTKNAGVRCIAPKPGGNELRTRRVRGENSEGPRAQKAFYKASGFLPFIHKSSVSPPSLPCPSPRMLISNLLHHRINWSPLSKSKSHGVWSGLIRIWSKVRKRTASGCKAFRSQYALKIFPNLVNTSTLKCTTELSVSFTPSSIVDPPPPRWSTGAGAGGLAVAGSLRFPPVAALALPTSLRAGLFTDRCVSSNKSFSALADFVGYSLSTFGGVAGETIASSRAFVRYTSACLGVSPRSTECVVATIAPPKACSSVSPGITATRPGPNTTFIHDPSRRRTRSPSFLSDTIKVSMPRSTCGSAPSRRPSPRSAAS